MRSGIVVVVVMMLMLLLLLVSAGRLPSEIDRYPCYTKTIANLIINVNVGVGPISPLFKQRD